MIADVYLQDLRALIADAPQVFVFEGVEYIGTISGANNRRKLEIGGFDEMPEMTLVIALKDADGAATFDGLPEVNEKVTVGTVTYRIERTEIDPFNAGFQMDLRSQHV